MKVKRVGFEFKITSRSILNPSNNCSQFVSLEHKTEKDWRKVRSVESKKIGIDKRFVGFHCSEHEDFYLLECEGV